MCFPRFFLSHRNPCMVSAARLDPVDDGHANFDCTSHARQCRCTAIRPGRAFVVEASMLHRTEGSESLRHAGWCRDFAQAHRQGGFARAGRLQRSAGGLVGHSGRRICRAMPDAGRLGFNLWPPTRTGRAGKAVCISCPLTTCSSPIVVGWHDSHDPAFAIEACRPAVRGADRGTGSWHRPLVDCGRAFSLRSLAPQRHTRLAQPQRSPGRLWFCTCCIRSSSSCSWPRMPLLEPDPSVVPPNADARPHQRRVASDTKWLYV